MKTSKEKLIKEIVENAVVRLSENYMKNNTCLKEETIKDIRLYICQDTRSIIMAIKNVLDFNEKTYTGRFDYEELRRKYDWAAHL